MGRMTLGTLVVGLVLLAAPRALAADDAAIKKDLEKLSRMTGLEPMQAALKTYLDDDKKAKELVRVAVPLAKDKKLSYNAAFVLGLAAADLKDMKSAEALFRVCMDDAAKLQSVRKLAQSYVTLIELFFENKQYGDAARICNELIKLNTDDSKPRIVYRAFTDEKGETDYVEDTRFDSASRIRPVVRQTLVKVMAKQGKYEQALKLVDGLIKEQGDFRDRHLKGWVQREAGQLEKAAATIEDAVERVAKEPDLDPEERDFFVERYRYELSNIYVDLKQIDKAAAHLEFLVKKKPEEPGYHNDLGYILADHDMRLDEAEAMVRKALELDRAKRRKSPGFDPAKDHDNGAYLDSLGWVLFKKKDYAGAKKYLLQAVADKAAQHIEIYDHLGDVHMALGEREAAQRAWEKGLEVVTDSRRDQERRAVVEKKLDKLRKSAKSSN